jgi:hypothetical protein
LKKPVNIAPLGTLLALHRATGAWQVVAVIDTSVSLHSRQTEICFWAQLLRDRFRFVFVTQDRETYKQQRSELGRSCGEASSGRRMLETYTDGVYLVRPYEDRDVEGDVRTFCALPKHTEEAPVFDVPGVQGHTEYCSQVHPLDALPPQLMIWSSGINAATT